MNTRKQNWVCYDAECGLCIRWAERFGGLLERHGFILLPLQSAAVRDTLQMPDEELLAEMRVITSSGRIFGGADALVYLSRAICKPLFWLAHVPGVRPLLRKAYRFVAKRRTCGTGTCKNRVGKRTDPTTVPQKNLADWLPLLVLPPTAAVIGRKFPPWIYMWLLAFALFAGCKWLCFRRTRTKGVKAGRVREIGFLLGWIGMDAENFLLREKTEQPCANEWIFAAVKTVFGASLLWVGARWALTINPLFAGWTGMLGVIFLLHFGLFHLLALAWHATGVPATPLMRAPLLSRSVGEFWGNRWNTAFHELTTALLFRPLRRAVNAPVAIMLAFLASGLIHDFVISVPAHGGYGLPTLYFLVQGAAVLFEHTKFARRLGLGRGIRGWLFMFLVTAGPAFWLFHPPFIHHVILPMLHAIGAT